jgi:hypothetical protein
VRRALGQRDPEDHIDEDAEAAEEHGHQPRQPYERRAEAEPLRDPARDSGEHPVAFRSREHHGWRITSETPMQNAASWRLAVRIPAGRSRASRTAL